MNCEFMQWFIWFFSFCEGKSISSFSFTWGFAVFQIIKNFMLVTELLVSIWIVIFSGIGTEICLPKMAERGGKKQGIDQKKPVND